MCSLTVKLKTYESVLNLLLIVFFWPRAT